MAFFFFLYFTMLTITTFLLILGFSTTVLAANGACDLPKYCTPSQVIGCMKSIDFGNTYYKEAVDDIIKLVEPYVYLDILKNPPQPKGFNDYFKPVDLIAELRKVKTEGTNFYEFYRSVQKALISVHDGHFGFGFGGNKDFDNMLATFFVSPPLKLYLDINNKNEPVMKGVPLMLANGDDIYSHFSNGAATKEIIERNKDNYIVSINGMSPFDFVLTFGSEYYNDLKNKDAKYTFASKAFSKFPLLYFFPMLEKDLTNLNIVYSNGESFTSDFFFINLNVKGTRERSDIGSLKAFARQMLKNNPERKVIGFDDVLKAYNDGKKLDAKKLLTEEDAIQALKNFDFEKALDVTLEKKTNTGTVAKTTNEVTWEYSTADSILKCRVDEINKMDVFFINSFSAAKTEDFLNVLSTCTKTFDGNEYPIVVINDYNSGGTSVLAVVFQEMLQQDMTARKFMSFKNDKRVHQLITSSVQAGNFQNPATGKPFTTVEELMEGAEVDDFGNGVTHSRSKPALSDYLYVRNKMDPVKPKFKRNRKPTEIIVFTDSYSASAGANFNKGLRESGAAILVGYNGYPGSKKESFDIGQAPAMVKTKGLDILGKEEYNRLIEKGITFESITTGEIFRASDVENGIKPLVPREFLVDAPDERVAIYSAYDDSKYDVFIEAAKGVFEKYKTQCNPDNLGLHMRNVLCDEKINKTHMHGGYVCGTDGKWSTQCEGYYCDIGYYFDTKTKECVVDPFSKVNSSNTLKVSIWALLLVLAFILF